MNNTNSQSTTPIAVSTSSANCFSLPLSSLTSLISAANLAKSTSRYTRLVSIRANSLARAVLPEPASERNKALHFSARSNVVRVISILLSRPRIGVDPPTRILVYCCRSGPSPVCTYACTTF